MKTQAEPPYSFVVERLSRRSPVIRPMFGCHAVYVDEKIVLILRNRNDHPSDNGVWLATAREHHDDLRRIFPSMRSIRLLGAKVTEWQNLPSSEEDFEQSVLEACDMILKNDSRIGKIPHAKRKSIRKR